MKVNIENHSKSLISIELHDTEVSNRYFTFLEAQEAGGWFLTDTWFIYFGQRDRFDTTNDSTLAMGLDRKGIFPVAREHAWDKYKHFRKVLEDVTINFIV